MSRTTIAVILATGLLVNCFATEKANAVIEGIWDGGDGLWDDDNWNGGELAFDVFGIKDGSNGWKGPLNLDNEDEMIIINSGTVSYPGYDLDSDFRIKQGGSMTISGGATWQQVTEESWIYNRWTRMDPSNLTMDGGTFRREGIAALDEDYPDLFSGGALIFGTWQGDDNWDVAPIEYMEINIEIKNGGRLENEGELWFGSWGDMPPGGDDYETGSVITMTINDGSVDLTGGHLVSDPATPAHADLVFSNHFSIELDPEEFQPTFAVNFAGPGTFTVDRSGIINAYVDENGDWQGLEPITYQELWDAGILQADGMSGPDGANFDSYFTVTGMLGADNYTLTRAVLIGDYDNSGRLDEPDLNLQAEQIVADPGDPAFDLNNDGEVTFADRQVWINDLAITWMGDANLNCVFDSSDQVQKFVQGKYEKDVVAGWADGDSNGDMRFNSSDMVADFVAGGYELAAKPGCVLEPPVNAAVSAVPEPSSVVLAIFGLLGLLGLTRRRI